MLEGNVQNETSYTPHSPTTTKKHRKIESNRLELCMSMIGRICEVLHTQRKHRFHLQCIVVEVHVTASSVVECIIG